MNTLVFDTSNDTLTVGLLLDDGRKAARSASGSRHSEILFPAIQECFAECGVSASELGLIVCTLGPGSFTGLRIGLASAKGMSLALDRPWIGIPTLDVFSWIYKDASIRVVPLLDARKNRLFAAIYEGGDLRGGYMDISEADLYVKLKGFGKVLFTGPGVKILSPAFSADLDFSFAEPSPEELVGSLAALGAAKLKEKGPASEDEGPLYLREPEIG